jgi:stress-induced-phosphoprotein 1
MASNEAKARGNAAFTAQRYEEAVAAFSEGIAVDPDNHILYR